MRAAILFGLIYIGDGIRRGLGVEGGEDVTGLFVILMGYCIALDVAEIFKSKG